MSFGPHRLADGSTVYDRQEWAECAGQEGILVNTVTPGVFRSDGTRQYMEMTGATQRYDPDDPADIWSWMHEANAGQHAGKVGRVGLPSELSPLLLLQGSPANSYIVGANIPVDGGTGFSGG